MDFSDLIKTGMTHQESFLIEVDRFFKRLAAKHQNGRSG
jgi:hypothetical protein